MELNIADNDDEIVLYEISGTLPKRDTTMCNTCFWKKAYIAIFAALFGSAFILIFLVILSVPWIT